MKLTKLTWRKHFARMSVSELMLGAASLSLASAIISMWVSRYAHARFELASLFPIAALLVGLVTILFNHLRYYRPALTQLQQLEELRAKYKARAELSDTRHAEKSELLEIALAHVNQGIALVDSEGMVLVFNKRAVEYTGLDETRFAMEFPLPFAAKEVVAAQWKAGEFGPNGELLPEEIRRYFLEGVGTLPKTYVRRRPNGTVLQLRVEDLPSGGMVQSFTDITELVAVKEAAEAAARVKSDFLATMSHEIRTPLNGILGMASLLRQTPLSADQAEYAETITNCGDALLSVINDILDVSKLEAGKLEIAPVAFDVARLAAASLRVVASAAKAKGLTLRVDVSPGLPSFVTGDEQRIRQVLLNLLGNSVKFTAHGSIALRVAPAPGAGPQRVRFEVADTGIGIPEAAKDRLFKPFSQVDASINRRFGGTGLGLNICKQLVEAMNGAIGVTTTEGKGSTFWFELPLPAAAAPAIADAAFSSTGARISLRVLVVEDMVVNQKVARKMLESLGHMTDIAATGEDALDKVKSAIYDLIFMDMQMPRMNGLEATAAIRALGDWHGTVPIIAMTANAFESDRQACLAAGMNDFVAKPINVPDLVAAIGRVAAHRPTPGRLSADAAGEWDEEQFKELLQFVGAEDLAGIVETFMRDARVLSQQLESEADKQDEEHRTRLLETLRDGAAVLGFSRVAAQCESAINGLLREPAVVHEILRSLERGAERARVLLSVAGSRSQQSTADPLNGAAA
jgi:signal transduction histidine kinase/CheY-like chemotaxis protein/HPt (histidine-containing phosphotransfer) domain-containing protein